MAEWKLNTPVALFIFIRPEKTARTLERIAQAKPPKLYVICDAPRETIPGDDEKCKATKALIDQINWPCEVFTNYSETNLGTKYRIASGIDWVFEKESEAIFLEDDCLPHPTFFRYCEELLERYRNDERIGLITGTNFHHGRIYSDASYEFSKYPLIWGWAGWRRSWKNYDVEMKAWPKLRDSGIMKYMIPNYFVRRYWLREFNKLYAGRIATWDYQWVLANFLQHRMCIIPRRNLISNIGFDHEATHTNIRHAKVANLPVSAMEFPMHAPKNVMPNYFADKYFEQYHYNLSPMHKVLRRIKSYM